MLTKENIAEKLLEHRSSKKITQAEVSKKSGVSVQTISAIESGKIKPQSMTVFRIREYLKFNQ